MNYAREVAAIRSKRDGQWITAQKQLRELRERRDREVFRLHTAGWAPGRIGVELGCARATIISVLDPEERQRLNALRRRDYDRERRREPSGRRLKAI